jgi:hypothetical protein
MFKRLVSSHGYFANIVLSKLPQLTVLAKELSVKLFVCKTNESRYTDKSQSN